MMVSFLKFSDHFKADGNENKCTLNEYLDNDIKFN